MSDLRKKLLLVLAYSGTFLVVFLLSLYLTFDANSLRPIIEQEAAKRKLELKIQDISLRGLFGLELSGIRVAPAGEQKGEENAAAFRIDRLVLSPSFSTVFSLLEGLGKDGKKGTGPALAFAFSASMGEGKLSGRVRQKERSLKLSAEAKKLSLKELPLESPFVKGLRLYGTLSGKLNLEAEDQLRTETWNGNADLNLKQAGASEFEVMGAKVSSLAIEEGELKAKIEKGVARLAPLKLQGKDLNLALEGTVALKLPLRKSILDIKGPVHFSDDFKKRNPVLSGFLPSTDNYSYRGTLEGMLTGM